MSSPTPRRLRSGKASRNSVINFRTAARPFFGSCIGEWTNMSDVASSFTILGFQGFPQNSLNQRATAFLFSCIGSPPYVIDSANGTAALAYSWYLREHERATRFPSWAGTSHEGVLLNVVSCR